MRKEQWLFQENIRTSLFEQIYNNFKGIKFYHWLARKFTVCEIAEINLKSEIRISYSLKLAQYRKILKRSPSIYKPIRFFVAIHGNAWVYMVIHGSTWQYMDIHGYTWQYMVINGNLWLYKAIHGSTWAYMAIHGNTWKDKAIHGNTFFFQLELYNLIHLIIVYS